MIHGYVFQSASWHLPVCGDFDRSYGGPFNNLKFGGKKHRPMRRKESQEWGDGRKRALRITSNDPNRFKSPSEDIERLGAEEGGSSDDRSVEDVQLRH